MVGEFDRLLVDNADLLKPFAFSLTRDNESARDLMQETLYRALANQEKYRSGTNVKAWLFTIMRNIFINDYRRKVKQRKIFEGEINDHVIDNTRASKTDNAETSLQLKDVHQAIHELPEIFRTPFTMFYEGYKYIEIAEILNEPLGTIKSRIHFARKLLQTQLTRG